MGKTIGRRIVDVQQKARGRLTLRYELEVIPYLCGDLPDDVTHCSFAWERGSKLFVTEAEQVNPNTHAVFWKQYLRQTATMYKDHTELLPKDYSFKVQSVKVNSKGEEKRKTVGKAHVNMAQFCSEALDAQPQEVLLHLKPCGKLKVSIKATWLRNARVDADAMTEVTANSLYTDSHYDEEGQEQDGWDEGAGQQEEQDLSGFDPETGQPLSHQGRYGDGASTSGTGEAHDEHGKPVSGRKSRKQRRRRHRNTYDEEGIPEGEGKQRLQVYGASSKAGDGGAGGGGGGSAMQIEAGRQVHRKTLRDYLCCCLPGAGPAEDPLEGDGLLAQAKLGNSSQATGPKLPKR
ncbi:hypothetical protein GPECTOR_69g447 [Gonium pectorale]|uniref:C2 NT-type domain-containing protein n=1 Tax=Gonium pectorale TaxID=33097 RepID=A0A150G3F5_GONPE|nr:hypothetical protein GPECTOR_69g447 [Gonium pectorale]|eukprot:KXZ44354.1 hypothetical protein GPECTOR_69g447 [Gonium pectorale]